MLALLEVFSILWSIWLWPILSLILLWDWDLHRSETSMWCCLPYAYEMCWRNLMPYVCVLGKDCPRFLSGWGEGNRHCKCDLILHMLKVLQFPYICVLTTYSVLTDDCMQFLGITDASCVIHFSFPSSPRIFGQRLYNMSDNFYNVTEVWINLQKINVNIW